MTSNGRSLTPIDLDDLECLARIARLDRVDLFHRKPRYGVLADRLIAVALCQGAALHFLDGQNGVKDFDVWTFYAAHPDVTFPLRRTVARFRRPQVRPVTGPPGVRRPQGRSARALSR